jgi:hypothetical protein
MNKVAILCERVIIEQNVHTLRKSVEPPSFYLSMYGSSSIILEDTVYDFYFELRRPFVEGINEHNGSIISIIFNQ